MSIKPITYQGISNFKSNLYALEVKSRFINQNDANGYYKAYGEELRAIVSGNIITIGSGALLIQGRLNEIEPGGESVEVNIQNGYVGYVVARIETYHPDDTENCTLVVKVGMSLDSITFTQDDTYQRTAESENKVYELPLYSFSMSGGIITNVVKIISPIEENTKTREIAINAKSIAEGAKSVAESAALTASNAAVKANNAKSVAESAALTASSAAGTANNAKSIAESAASTASSAASSANDAKAKVDAAIAAVANVMYPVGSIYMSVSSTNPKAFFGGKWEPWGCGRVPVGVNAEDGDFSEAEKTGGEKTHVLTMDEMPTHAHAIHKYYGSSEDKSIAATVGGTTKISGMVQATETNGLSKAHNNLQPYITCYMWKRIE